MKTKQNVSLVTPNVNLAHHSQTVMMENVQPKEMLQPGQFVTAQLVLLKMETSNVPHVTLNVPLVQSVPKTV